MTTEFPNFITKQYLQNVLNKFEGHAKNATLVDYSIEHGTKKGDNFASCVLRAKLNYKIDGTVKDVSFIIKAKSESSVVAEFLDACDVFKKEAFVYEKILAKCEQLDPKTKIAPR